MKRQCVTVILLLCTTVSIYGQNEVGGTSAPDGRYPYQVSLRRKGKFLCGASIINERWILTATHCIKVYKKIEDASVIVGTNNLYGVNGTEYKVVKMVMHEDYDKDYIHANDIALVRVAEDIQFSKKVQPVKLPKDNSNTYEGELATLTGWGSFSRNETPVDLQHVRLKVIGNPRCVLEWKKGRNRDILDSQICTTAKLEENLATHGDSGGPLVSKGVQIGVVSFAWQDMPDVFARVSYYLGWINSKIS